jgi:hypothetical protein
MQSKAITAELDKTHQILLAVAVAVLVPSELTLMSQMGVTVEQGQSQLFLEFL